MFSLYSFHVLDVYKDYFIYTFCYVICHVDNAVVTIAVDTVNVSDILYLEMYLLLEGMPVFRTGSLLKASLSIMLIVTYS